MTIKQSGYLNNNGATRITENNGDNGGAKAGVVGVEGDTKATKSEKKTFTFKILELGWLKNILRFCQSFLSLTFQCSD